MATLSIKRAPRATVLLVRGSKGSPGMKEMLEAQDYETEAVPRSPEVFEKLKVPRYQAVILDFEIAEKERPQNDSALVDAAVKSPGNPAVVVCAVQPTMHGAIAALRQGVYDYLTAPVEPTTLFMTLEAGLEKRRSMLELVSLRKVVEVFNSLQNLETTYNHLRQTIAELFHSQSCSIALLDADRGEIVAQTPSYGAQGDTVPKHRFRVSDSRVSKLILETNDAYITNSVPDDPMFEPAPKGLENLLAVPMRSTAGPLGFIYVANRPGSFSTLDSDLLLALGEQVGVALKSAHSFDAAYHASITDPLTDLYNRRFFDARLRQEVARVQRSGRSLGLMFVDLDSFKQINDVHGHDAGNLVLTEVSRILRQCSRSADVPARWGGDEFTVLLTEAEPASLEMIAKRVRDTILQTNWGPVGRVTATIGIAVMPQDAETLEELLKASDEAMYLAKKRGKNCYALASEAGKSVKGGAA